MSKKIDITIGSFLKAGKLSHEFNIASQYDDAHDKVSSVLTTALDLMLGEITPNLLDGFTLTEGSAWHGPDEVLSRKSAQSVAKNLEDQELSDTKTFGLTDLFTIHVNDNDYQKIADLKQAFALAHDYEAVRLAIHTYNKTKRAAHRGSGHTYMKDIDDLYSESRQFNFDLLK